MGFRKLIYLDYNIFEGYRKDEVPKLRDVIDGLRATHLFPYSPAHLEDLASSLAWREFEEAEIKAVLERCQSQLQNIIDISEMLEIFPGKGHNPTRVVEEHPGACLMRVLKHFDRNRFLDVRERNLLESLKANDAEGEISSKVSNLPVGFLSLPEYSDRLEKKFSSDLTLMKIKGEAGLASLKWSDISKSHGVLEHVFEVVMNFLEEIRFRPERLSKSRSRMHDVTHAIYATKADVFVTGDERFYHKVKAAYNYLEVPTKILSQEEFISGFRII